VSFRVGIEDVDEERELSLLLVSRSGAPPPPPPPELPGQFRPAKLESCGLDWGVAKSLSPGGGPADDAFPSSELKNALEYADAEGVLPLPPTIPNGSVLPRGGMPPPEGKVNDGGFGLRLGLMFCSLVTRNC